MNYWLIKSEPNTYSWDDLVAKGTDHWDGVRNYAARNNMKAMKVGDLAFFYHSVKEKAIVGIAECVKEYYPDPTTDDDRWVVVDFSPKQKLEKPVTLEDIKADDRLQDMDFLRLSRLSVQSVKKEEFDIILEKSQS
ncbi:putative RNA-binding protein with PUA-like domain [Roseivirga ehrenbergii]|uniref:Ubiquinol-cytochrome C reductase n=1 Tax=Roseivirga ehrenbergii (strain DSM 102268 / JCM 13514 / KCTC 12282 / NCIMB 14502 / KMM 6017) TaxID=279360 RepID=A0A150XS98_ROSEK|nr:EVE domain-containing protein [Roseivirga ehrenbergii]KYG81472.1 ubiquinol-cytochrome C reductase [Roseivirga ehrenbergii]TCL10622.1 putative RNA-binding protein with PUA-like domain [Roseivirga ehrenbergii]